VECRQRVEGMVGRDEIKNQRKGHARGQSVEGVFIIWGGNKVMIKLENHREGIKRWGGKKEWGGKWWLRGGGGV